MALALPIAHQLHASAGITALGVMLTGQSFGAPLPNILTNNISSSGVGWGWGGEVLFRGDVGITERGGGGGGGGVMTRGRGGKAIWWRQWVCMQLNIEVYAATQSLCISPWTLRW